MARPSPRLPLRDLEEHGIVSRKVFAEVPPRVESSLTRLGKTLEPLIHALCDWGKRYANELRRHMPG